MKSVREALTLLCSLGSLSAQQLRAGRVTSEDLGHLGKIWKEKERQVQILGRSEYLHQFGRLRSGALHMCTHCSIPRGVWSEGGALFEVAVRDDPL